MILGDTLDLSQLPIWDDLEVRLRAFLILFARVGAILMLLPVFSDDSIPGRFRLFIAFGMTFALSGLLGVHAEPFAGNEAALPAILIAELMVGLAMGAIVKIMFLAISIAGSVISMQTGLSAAMLFDPAQGGQAAIISKFVTVAATVFCMALQVHHLWIAAIVQSYDLFPVGGLPPAEDFAQLAIATVTQSMALGISLAAPLLIYGIVFNVGLGMAARLAPAIQVFFIAQPLNILLGIALFASLIGAILTGFATALAEWMNYGWA